jgi:gamma-glutamylcyclotransferase
VRALGYLAYGSNMLCARLLRRVSSARDPRVARVPGYRVRYRKLSVDGSAKCDLVHAGGSAAAFGVLYDIDDEQQAILDRFEGVGDGYHRASVTVLVDGRPQEALTYLADDTHLVEALAPYDWYRDLVVAGAREHGLPGAYIGEQLDVPAAPDPDAARDRREREALGESRCG